LIVSDEGENVRLLGPRTTVKLAAIAEPNSGGRKLSRTRQNHGLRSFISFVCYTAAHK
jgi:hypothetical protein